jgi:hypothetical protein
VEFSEMMRALLPLIAITVAWPAAARATVQVSDRVRYNGVDGFLEECPLGDLLWQMVDPPEFEWITTANWKGYVAEWEVKDGAFYLTSFEGKLNGKMVGPEVILPGRKLPVRAEWYTGRLRIVMGKVVHRPPGGGRYDFVFERGAELEVKKGKVVRSQEFPNYRIKSRDEEREIERARHCVWPLPLWERGSAYAISSPVPKRLAIVIAPAAAIRRTPAWTDGESPYSPLKAMIRAEAKSREFLPADGKYTWNLKTAEIKKAFDDRHYYEFFFEPNPLDVVTKSFYPTLRLLVLMDGTIPEPVRWGSDRLRADDAGFFTIDDPPRDGLAARWEDDDRGAPWSQLPWRCRLSLVGSIVTAPKLLYEVEKLETYSDGVWADFAVTNASDRRKYLAPARLAIPLRTAGLWDAAGERWVVPHDKYPPASQPPDEFVAVEPGRAVRYRARVDRLGRSLEPFGLVEGRRPRPAAVEYFVAAWPPAHTRLTATEESEVQVFAFGYGRVPVRWSDKPFPPEWPAITRLPNERAAG